MVVYSNYIIDIDMTLVHCMYYVIAFSSCINGGPTITVIYRSVAMGTIRHPL